jgi:hypothetical protein
MCVLAWASSDRHQTQAKRAATWLVENRQVGGFGSTQATVLALKALIRRRDAMVGHEGGEVEVLVDDQVLATIRWTGRPADGQVWRMTPVFLEAISGLPAKPWKLRSADGSPLPVTVAFQGRTDSPDSDPACPIALELDLPSSDSGEAVAQGDTVEVNATVTNTSRTGLPMSVAVIGLPGGLEPVIESLDKLRDSGQIDYYELRGRDLVLYWRTIAPAESKQIVVPCVAEVGGRYTGPASRAYLYYTAESKTWEEPLVVTID